MKHHPNHGKRQKINQNPRFFILTVGHKNVRLYKGDLKSIELCNIKGLPADMKQTLGIDEYANERSVHSVMRAGRATQVSASQYNPDNTDKIMLKEFFRRIDDMLRVFLTQHNYPLVLAGVDYIQAMYRTVNSYPQVVESWIAGNHDETKPHDLHHQALAIIASQ